MKLTIGGRTHEITEAHISPNGKIKVQITWEGRAIVSYQGKAKYYITSKAKARKMWAAAA